MAEAARLDKATRLNKATPLDPGLRRDPVAFVVYQMILK
jgi:hypothetical protein